MWFLHIIYVVIWHFPDLLSGYVKWFETQYSLAYEKIRTFIWRPCPISENRIRLVECNANFFLIFRFNSVLSNHPYIKWHHSLQKRKTCYWNFQKLVNKWTQGIIPFHNLHKDRAILPCQSLNDINETQLDGLRMQLCKFLSFVQ